MTTELQQIAKSNSVSLNLKKRNKAALTRVVKSLTPVKITDALQLRFDTSEDLAGLKNSLQFFTNEYEGENKEEYIGIVLKKLQSTKEVYAELHSIKNLAELSRENQEGLIDDIEWIILETVRYFDVPKTSILEYTRMLAEEIVIDWPGFTIEDVLLCFQRAKDGIYGDIYARLDGQIIKGWLRKYAEARDVIITSRNESKHMASKAGNNHGRSAQENSAKMLDIAKTTVMLENEKATRRDKK